MKKYSIEELKAIKVVMNLSDQQFKGHSINIDTKTIINCGNFKHMLSDKQIDILINKLEK